MKPTKGVNLNRARPNAGTSLRSSGASFARELRAWWHTQTLFGRQADLEAAHGIRAGTFALWMAGRAFPSDQWCDVLFSLTRIPYFSSEGRQAARTEHEQKRGLSHAGIAKRLARKRVTPEQLAECLADIRKAKTIAGPDVIVCLGRKGDTCGQVLKALKARGSGAHLAEHGYKSNDEYRDEWGYSHDTSLVSQSHTLRLRKLALEGGHLKPDAGLGYLRSPKKGRRMSHEYSLKLAERMTGTRNPERDAEVARLWLVESASIETIASTTALSQGRVHVILQRIFGIRVKQRIVFSRGEPVTNRWLANLCQRFGGMSPSELRYILDRLLGQRRVEASTARWWRELISKNVVRALTPEEATPLVAGEGKFLQILAKTNGNRADYLRAAIPDLVAKRDGASLALGIARKPDGLKNVVVEAETGNPRARIALAFLPRAVTWLPTLTSQDRELPVSELVRRFFLPMELGVSPFLLREAIERTNSIEGQPAILHSILRSAAEKGGRRATRRELFEQARRLRAERMQWPEIAKRLDPEAYARDPLRTWRSIRQGVKDLPE